MLRDVPRFNLLAGDRLEPSVQLPDVAEFSAVRVPFIASFWRSHHFGHACIDPVNHRNPLFTPRLHISPTLTFMLDALHIMYLGVHQRIIAAILWGMLRANPWRIHGAFETVSACGIERLQENLFNWYDENKIPQDYRINRLEQSMIGEEHIPMMKTMGSETNAMLPWAVKLCGVHARTIEYGHDLHQAALALERYVAIIKRSPKRIPREIVAQLLDLAICHNEYTKRADLPLLFKHHFLYTLHAESISMVIQCSTPRLKTSH